jgi:hypothetical protein
MLLDFPGTTRTRDLIACGAKLSSQCRGPFAGDRKRIRDASKLGLELDHTGIGTLIVASGEQDLPAARNRLFTLLEQPGLPVREIVDGALGVGSELSQPCDIRCHGNRSQARGERKFTPPLGTRQEIEGVLYSDAVDRIPDSLAVAELERPRDQALGSSEQLHFPGGRAVTDYLGQELVRLLDQAGRDEIFGPRRQLPPARI